MAAKHRPALSPEAREDQLIAAAVDLAEKKLQAGTASTQLIVHYLRLGTEKTKLEAEKLRHENQLLEAKTDAIKSQQRSEEIYAEALDAMRLYRGESTDDQNEDDWY